MSVGSIPYCPSRRAHASPAAPCSQQPQAAAASGSRCCPSRDTIMPASTSPLPPTAMPGLPVGFMYSRSPSVMQLRWPLSTMMQPRSVAAVLASVIGSLVRGIPSRANSPAWGVRMVVPALPRSKSICRAARVMPSASSTSGQGTFCIAQQTISSVSSLSPRPQPSRTASIRGRRASISRMASRQSMPPRSGRGWTMASFSLTASIW